MARFLRFLTLSLLLSLTNVQLSLTQDTEGRVFHWHGAVTSGKTVVVHGVNGSIDASLSGDNELQVEARISGPAESAKRVNIAVSETADGILICPVPEGTDSGRHPEKGCEGASFPENVRVDFKVELPAGVNLVAHNVNGEVKADSLKGTVAAATVNGDISISTTEAITTAHSNNGSLDLSMGKLWSGLLALRTENGNVRLLLPRNVSFQPSGKGNARITGSGPVQMKGIAVSQSGTKGKAPELEISTIHGSVTIGTID